jgi:hypothetical protein
MNERLSVRDIEVLLKLKQGVGGLSDADAKRFVELGWVENKFGGYVLTAVGRYQIAIRERETGLTLLVRRWRRRAEALQSIADTMSQGRTDGLIAISGQWKQLADQLEKLAALEKAEKFLT